MTPQKELKLGYSLAIALLIVGVLSFAAFPSKTPDEPMRIMYKSVAGKVLFDHKTHSADAGYALTCEDCHHHFEFEGSAGIDGKEPVVQACGVCHQIPAEGETFPKSCMECHEEEDIEDTEFTAKRADAYHAQCEGCHQEIETGPVEERCNWCHVM